MTAAPQPDGRDHRPMPGVCRICGHSRPITYGPLGETVVHDRPVPAFERVCDECIRTALTGRPPRSTG